MFEHVKSGFSKFQNVKKPGFQNAKYGCLEMPKCQESGFSKTHKIQDFRENRVFTVSGFPKGRRMPPICPNKVPIEFESPPCWARACSAHLIAIWQDTRKNHVVHMSLHTWTPEPIRPGGHGSDLHLFCLDWQESVVINTQENRLYVVQPAGATPR